MPSKFGRTEKYWYDVGGMVLILLGLILFASLLFAVFVPRFMSALAVVYVPGLILIALGKWMLGKAGFKEEYRLYLGHVLVILLGLIVVAFCYYYIFTTVSGL